MQKPLYGLKENPLSRAIYGDEADVDDLAKSLKETGQLTPLLIKPDGTILSGHRRYRAARKAGLITLNVEVRTPRDKAEEELIIISANKQREKTASQLLREDERLRAIYSHEGREKISQAVSNANKGRGQATSPTFSETKKVEIKPTSSVAEPEFNIEEIYEGAMERTAEAESQMRNSAIGSTPPEGQSTPSAAQSQPLERQSTPRPAPINMHKRIAKELGISTNQLHQLRMVGEAAKAGVPEAKEAMRQLDRNEITINKASSIVQKALHPELATEKAKPDRVDKICDAFTSVNPIVRGVIDDIESETPEINVLDAKHIVDAAMKHIKLINIMKEKLFIYIEDKEVEQQHAEG